jgi:hemin uptake protein HemP
MSPLPAPTPDKKQDPVPTSAAGHKDARRRHIFSSALFDGGRAVEIDHAGVMYTLRQTSKGKLILTK